MTEFRLTQISDTHLARRLQKLTDNFHRVSEHIDATRPDLVINSGDISFDGPTSRSDLEFAKELHDALPVPCRHLPGNHDIGDNPTAVGPAPKQPATEKERQNYLVRHRRGPLALRRGRLVLYRAELADHEHRDRERGRAVRLARLRASQRVNGKPVALFLHKPLYLNTPDDPELEASAIRYVPQPRRKDLIEMFARGRSAAGRLRPRPSAPRLHLWPHPPCLGAVRRLHHSRPDAGSDRHQGSRAGGVSLPARQF